MYQVFLLLLLLLRWFQILSSWWLNLLTLLIAFFPNNFFSTLNIKIKKCENSFQKVSQTIQPGMLSVVDDIDDVVVVLDAKLLVVDAPLQHKSNNKVNEKVCVCLHRKIYATSSYSFTPFVQTSIVYVSIFAFISMLFFLASGKVYSEKLLI